MKTIFWMQADSPAADDFFFVDGRQINSNSNEAKMAYDLIRKCHEYSRFDKNEVLQWRKELKNDSLILYYVPFTGLFYQSTVREFASDCRKKTVTILCSSPTVEKFKEIAMYANEFGYSFRDEEFGVINKLIERHICRAKRIKINFLISLITLLLCSIIVIIKK